MAVLMNGYPKENISSLSIRADYAQSDVASRYFHIIEGRVLKSIINPRVETGEAYVYDSQNDNSNSLDFQEEKKRYAIFKKRRLGIFVLARELVWLLGNWKSNEFKKFLDEVEPDVLVCPIESYIHFNRINEYIIKTKHPKVIGVLWDDNFTYRQQNKWWYFIHRYFLRKGVRRMINHCSVVFATSPKMQEECNKEFGINSQLLTKPIFFQQDYQPYIVGNPIRIIYTGNLYVNRDKTIATISRVLDKINENEIKVVLDIYTNSVLTEKQKTAIVKPGYCAIHPPVPSAEVKELQARADILLVAEAIGRSGDMSARLSFSTKITDYFLASKCIWAVGNPELASINYLANNDAALISIDEASILSVLNRVVSTPELINEYAYKGTQCGKLNHSAADIQNKLYAAIDS